MKKNIKKQNARPVVSAIFSEARNLILSARKAVVRNVDTIQVITNYEIGRRIIEHEQEGDKRARYGKQLIEALSKKLSKEFGKGFSERNLRNMRKFYLMYHGPKDRIWQTVSAKLQDRKSRTLSAKLKKSQKRQAASGKLTMFILSWSHYVFLIGLGDEKERSFYEIEAAEQNWSLRELKRQFNSSLYERLALSRDKKEVKQLSQKGQINASGFGSDADVC